MLEVLEVLTHQQRPAWYAGAVCQQLWRVLGSSTVSVSIIIIVFEQKCVNELGASRIAPCHSYKVKMGS